jgi:hypothetical protein
MNPSVRFKEPMCNHWRILQYVHRFNVESEFKLHVWTSVTNGHEPYNGYKVYMINIRCYILIDFAYTQQ